MTMKNLIRTGLLASILSLTAGSCLLPAQTVDKEHLNIGAYARRNSILDGQGIYENLLDSHVYGLYGISAGLSTRPEDGNWYEWAYNYPTFGLGLSYGRSGSLDFKGQSRLGDIANLYGWAEFDLVRTRSFRFGPLLELGLAFTGQTYDYHTNPANRFIGSHVFALIGTGLQAEWLFTPQWALTGGVYLTHHSNGMLRAPNLGINEFSLGAGVRHYLAPVRFTPRSAVHPGRPAFPKGLHWQVFAAAGVHSCPVELDGILKSVGAWTETLSTTVMHWGQVVADKAKLVLKINTGAAVLGLGYIVGLKYAFIICCGSLLVWLVAIPLMGAFCGGVDILGMSFSDAISQWSADEIFRTYARQIGIGGIATAGIIGIIKQAGVIKSAVGLAMGEFRKKDANAQSQVERTQRDLPMKTVVFGIVLTLLAVFAFFAFGGIVNNVWQAIVGLLIVAVIAFLFTTVAANAIAIVGTNPVSGMTIMTLIITALVLVACGLKGNSGMVAALLIGGVVCTALSTAGGFITDLKIGYWIGTTPAKQEGWKFLGVLVAAATVAGVVILLNKTYGFTGPEALVAPQANAMAAVIQPMMEGGSAPWLMYGIGAVIAILLTIFKIPALAFCLGMFIPIDLNLPLLVGGAISWYVGSRS